MLTDNQGQTQANLEQSVELLNSVFNSMPEAIAVLDEHLRIKTVNQAFLHLFNITSHINNIPLHELGEGDWNMPELRNALEHNISNPLANYRFEFKHAFSGIGSKVILVKGRKILQDTEKAPLFFITLEDLSGYNHMQKIMMQREAWFHELTDNVPVMIWVANTRKERLFFNKTWLTFTGEKVEDQVGNGWLNSVHPDDVEKVTMAWNNSYETITNYQIDYRLRRYDGAYRWVSGLAKPIYETGGEFSGFLGTCSEIHDQQMLKEELEARVKRRTRALQEANANLERSNSDLQQFAYVASHDLQEPLRKIITFSDRLQNKYHENLSEDANVYIEKITSSAQRMTRLIDDLLNFSRVSKTDEQFTETDLGQIVNKVLKDFDTHISRKAKISISHLPKLQAVPVQMTQLFHNLLSNAVKFSAEREVPEISVNCRRLAAEEIAQYADLKSGETYFEISVADNGIGFNQGFAEQIFVIFQRLHEKHTYPGTGIGLALCRKIVNYHHGVIFAGSEENHGATFFIILPEKQRQ